MSLSNRTKKIIAREVLIAISVVLIPAGIYLAHAWVNLVEGIEVYRTEDILDICYKVFLSLFFIVYVLRGIVMAIVWSIKILIHSNEDN